MRCRLFNIAPSLYPLEASSIPINMWQSKNMSRHSKSPLEEKTALGYEQPIYNDDHDDHDSNNSSDKNKTLS